LRIVRRPGSLARDYLGATDDTSLVTRVRPLPCERLGATYSVMIRSAHSTRDTKIAGLPNFAPHWFRSASVTPRAREQAPQDKDRNVFGNNFFDGFAERGPPHWHDCIHSCFAHGIGGFPSEENLHIVTGVCQRKPVSKDKLRSGWVIRAPRTFHHDL